MREDQGLEQSLQEIRRRFENSLAGRIEKVDDLWNCLQAGWNEELARNMYCEVHRMYGTCGSLGFGLISEMACEIHSYLKTAIEEQRLPDEATQNRITELVYLLGQNCCGDKD